MTWNSLRALCYGYDKTAYADPPSVCYSDPIFDAVGQTIHPGNHQSVSWPQEFQEQFQLGSPAAAGTRCFLGTDDLTAGRTERLFLKGSIQDSENKVR